MTILPSALVRSFGISGQVSPNELPTLVYAVSGICFCTCGLGSHTGPVAHIRSSDGDLRP